jgi:Helix-turn-helix domain
MTPSIRDSGKAEALRKLEKKLERNRATMPTDAEVSLLSEEIREAFVASFPQAPVPTVYETEYLIRWHSLGERCRQARGERGWSFRDASVVTQIPQYRIRAIEDGRLSLVRTDLARRYFRALRIESWVARWSRANRELAEHAGLGLVNARR